MKFNDTAKCIVRSLWLLVSNNCTELLHEIGFTNTTFLSPPLCRHRFPTVALWMDLAQLDTTKLAPVLLTSLANSTGTGEDLYNTYFYSASVLAAAVARGLMFFGSVRPSLPFLWIPSLGNHFKLGPNFLKFLEVLAAYESELTLI